MGKTFAAINGACAGAGLAWRVHIRYAADNAVFNTAFMTAGLSGDFGGTWSLSRIVGPAKARELYLLAEKFDAAEAARIGLVSDVVPGDELMELVRSKAARVAGFAPLTAKAIKQNLNDALEVGWAEALDREADRHTRCGRTEDAREAASAFLEKRTPEVSRGDCTERQANGRRFLPEGHLPGRRGGGRDRGAGGVVDAWASSAAL